MGETVQINREDWISRFFGFLGQYEYLLDKRRMDGENDMAQLSTADDRRINNIVYVYGVPQGGKSTYMELLMEELRLSGKKYVCASYDLSMTQHGQGPIEFQRAMAKSFNRGGLAFPCLTMAMRDDYDSEEVVKSFTGKALDVFEAILEPSPFGAIRTIYGLKEELKQQRDERLALEKANKECVELLKDELKKRQKTKGAHQVFSKKQPFDFMKMDFEINAKLQENRRILCFIDGFEELQECLPASVDQEHLLAMMSEVPQIVWVLLSKEKPGKTLRKVIAEENRWRMGECSEKKAITYLKSVCPDMLTDWYKTVYKNTRGYIGLLDIVVEAQRDECRNYDYWVKGQPKMADSDTNSIVKQVELWLEHVWNGGPWEYEEEEDEIGPLKFLFESDFAYVENQGRYMDKSYRIPCLCYLVELSMQNIGTLAQFSWQRGASFLEMERIGINCVRYIEESTPFCREYVEYPGTLYLDPVIIGILSKHRKYREWLELFRSDCLKKQQQTDEKAETGAVHPVELENISMSFKEDLAQDEVHEKQVDEMQAEAPVMEETNLHTEEMAEQTKADKQKTEEEETPDASVPIPENMENQESVLKKSMGREYYDKTTRESKAAVNLGRSAIAQMNENQQSKGRGKIIAFSKFNK